MARENLKKKKRLTYKQVFAKEKEQRLAEKGIKQLKNKLRRLHNKTILNTYDILNQIYMIRKQFAKNYDLTDLSEEDIIDDLYSYNQICYIFTVRHFTSYAFKLIQENKITVAYLCLLIRKNKKFQDTLVQNKFLEKMLKGEITKKQIKKLNSYELRKKADIHISEEEETKRRGFVQQDIMNSWNDFKWEVLEHLDNLTNKTKQRLRGEIRDLLSKIKNKKWQRKNIKK